MITSNSYHSILSASKISQQPSYRLQRPQNVCQKKEKVDDGIRCVCIRLAQWKWISVCRAYFQLFYFFVSLLRRHSSARALVSVPATHTVCSKFIKNCARKKRKNKTQEKHHHKIVWLLLSRSFVNAVECLCDTLSIQSFAYLWNFCNGSQQMQWT